MQERRQRVREMFVSLSHGLGHARCDFGEALAVIGGVERRVHYLVMDVLSTVSEKVRTNWSA